MKKNNLCGDWKLYYCKQSRAESLKKAEPEANAECVAAKVPGNVELDLTRAGILPEDLYKGMNIKLVQKYEEYEWWYEKEFDASEIKGDGKKMLHFEGVDCIADYWLNGEFLGESRNMFVPVEFDITDKVKPKNRLVVHINSAVLDSFNRETPILSVACRWDRNFEGSGLRKAAHGYGWDIMPRVMSAGLWRDVSINVMSDCEVRQLYYVCRNVSEDSARVSICYDLDLESLEGMRVEVEGACGDSKFECGHQLTYKAGRLDVFVDNPKLWWPYGYGDANLYKTTVRFYRNDELAAEEQLNIGIRSVELLNSLITDGETGKFEFVINGERIMVKGSNWVPMDAFHSRDKERYQKAFGLVSDIGCNMLRCWGGNVYEDTEFYDYCDEHGVMIWQDFGMGCAMYPQDDEFLNELRREATIVVKKLRNHASIVLWAGDNECDLVHSLGGADPSGNRATREVLKQVVHANDLGRPYLASSPYISPQVYENGDDGKTPEAHLWGPRDYYKSSFYAHAKAHFTSETGYHGCPSRESIEKFIDADKLWPMENNEQWILHSTDMAGNDARIMLLPKQIKQLFGEVPTDMDDFIFASQISQAEAFKFFIENMRVHKDVKGGIIWWNLVDGWPQFSDAVVDYYYNKKIAYDYIKRSQQPVALMFGEIESWNLPLIATNDTLKAVSGTYKVTNVETDEVVLEGDFNIKANGFKEIGKVPVMYSDKGMFLIEWFIDGKRYINHYLYGMPAFTLADYKKWYNKIK